MQPGSAIVAAPAAMFERGAAPVTGLEPSFEFLDVIFSVKPVAAHFAPQVALLPGAADGAAGAETIDSIFGR